ncbi:hypothetical protein Mal15_42310 [Stieleria maiorica]|uniref:Nucleotidyl transferase AbiEii toxin, Type IV TA system n=1 Tax=Stieleria maiorica TaxID=2795974 RepID=A0A5B9MFY3_9BACT|nr:hypothetical protein [Stieleria maiorica]QEG00162.1 hypothetical protein Mal15_42310 [Stieleria maiorica]
MSPEEAAYKVMFEVTETLARCGDFVIVGGWVPELLFPNKGHAGSIDVDLVVAPDGVAQGIDLDDYLRHHGYRRCEKPAPTRYLRPVPNTEAEVAIDLLTTPVHQGKKVVDAKIGGVSVGSLPGLDLALRCHETLTIDGEDTEGKRCKITVKVARPEAFILIKAYPLGRRKKAKDAYDIAFILQHYQPDLRRLAARLAPLIETDSGREAYSILQNSFDQIDSEGPRKVAAFAQENGQDAELMRQAAYQDAQELFQTVKIASAEF